LGPPALDRRDAVLGGDGLPVVELEPVAKRERILHVVLAHGVLVHHLRLKLQASVESEQRVVDHVPVVARDVGRRPDRVEDLEVGMGDEAERAALFLRVDVGGGERYGGRGGATRQETTSTHVSHLVSLGTEVLLEYTAAAMAYTAYTLAERPRLRP